MTDRLLICTDLDRTLIPNGPQPESLGARDRFAALAARPEVTLSYVSGRHRALIKRAITHYSLPLPDFVIGDVGTTIYQVGPRQEWTHLTAWENEIGKDWGGKTHAQLKTLLLGLPALRLQEYAKQNRYKLSYYVPLHINRDELSALIRQRLTDAGIHSSLIWSVDAPMGIGLLDVLPARASKYHAIEALMKLYGFDYSNTAFCGDSGNDIEVLASGIPAVLVANSQADVRKLAQRLAQQQGHAEQLYIAQGGFMGMNGNYSAGVLEGICHYHPEIEAWMTGSPGDAS